MSGELTAADGVPITVAGKERRLIFGFPAMKVLEREFGGISLWLDNVNGGWKARRLAALETD